MIKNIVFDFGGVILTDDDVGVLFDNTELINKFPKEYKGFQEAWNKEWATIGECQIGILDFYDKLQKDVLGASDRKFSKQLFEFYKQRSRPLDAYYLLPKLKEKYKLFALPNAFKEGLKFKREKFKLDNYFDKIIASCEFQISKPDPKIFEILIKETAILPSESLFIDDREKNVKVGVDLGFQAYVYNGVDKLKEKFRELKIIYE